MCYQSYLTVTKKRKNGNGEFCRNETLCGQTQKKRRIRGVALHSDRKMERAMGAIRAEGDDGGETENGVRDTNTRDTDTYSSLKIESNYRQGAKRKMRRGEKEGMRSEVVMSVNVLWRKKSQT